VNVHQRDEIGRAAAAFDQMATALEADRADRIRAQARAEYLQQQTESILSEQHEVTGIVVTFHDITERQAIERMKNEFISIASHELRTPLTSLRGSLGLVGSGLLGAIPERAEHMIKNGDRQ